MPVRSMNSVVLKWPDRETVHAAARQWASQACRASGEVLRIGYFGSYATGKWGVGSDLDILILVASSDLPFERRGTRYATPTIPVPCQVLVYTVSEWQRMILDGSRFAGIVESEAVWLYER